jgi:predicted DNA-binding protein (MmcQ/YjbR family)
MDKKHWNTVIMEGDLPGVFIKQMIKNSYDLVLSKLPKKVQAELKG